MRITSTQRLRSNLTSEYSPEERKKRFFSLLFVVIGMLFFFFVFQSRNYIPVIFDFFFKKEIQLKKTSHVFHVLIMGVGGGTHDGPELTDTIMLASIDEVKNTVTFVSLPRDLWVEELQAKINTAYASGEAKQRNGGLVLAKAMVSKITNIPIEYVVVVDFNGFVKVIDELGGLDIDIEKTFDDYQYPVEEKREDLCDQTLEIATERIATMSATEVFPCRYEHVHFEKGPEHMDGKRALIYVRSRYATGEEGTDFARSKRQQKVIAALREKILTLGILLNPIKITNLFSVVKDSIHTNIVESEFDDFIKLAQKIKDAKISSHILETESEEKRDNELLVNPPIDQYNGMWVLVPSAGSGNYSEIQQFVSCVTKEKTCKEK